MTAQLMIQLLGGFQINDNRGPLAGFTNTRLQSVLAYLILNRATPQARQQLAYLFWPDSTDSQARTNLRNSLHLLRAGLPNADAYLSVDSLTIQWRPDAPAIIDVVTFDEASKTAQRAHDAAAQKAALEAALAAYTGELLPNCYDDWILGVREQWQQRYISTIEQLIELLKQRRDYRAALDHAQRLLQYDPLLETTYRCLMQLHAAQGDRAAALRIYHLCRTTLDRELGVEPSPTTQAIYERLLNLETASVAVEPVHMVTPLVGREQAWNELQDQWHQVIQGKGNEPAIKLVIVTGEAGIGKTRLVEELIEVIRRQGSATAAAYCYPAGGRLAYAPLQSWLRAPDIARHRTGVPQIWRQELARLLPELVDPTQVFNEPSPMTDRAYRRRLFEGVLQALTVGKTPLLLVLDDIQWCDSDTLDWLEFLLYSNIQAPILILATQRSGETTVDDALSTFRLALDRGGKLHDIVLTRLTQPETQQLVANLTGRMPDAIRSRTIFQETDGIPLFIVETIRANLQRAAADDAQRRTQPSGAGTQRGATMLPGKIQSVIEGRLVRLSPDARALADLAAVVGRAFTTDLLARASAMGEDELVQGLDELWQQQIIQEHAGRLEESYAFVHDKLREVVYGLLSPMRRRLLHRRVAEALENLNADALSEVSASIALHYEQAGQPLAAVEWLQRAARTAHRVSALHDALDLLNHALALVQAMDNQTAAATLGAVELPIQMQRGAIYLATKGHAAPEVEQALTRALALCNTDGTPQQRFAVLWGMGRYYLVKPDLDKGLAISQQILQLAEVSQSSDLLVEAYTTIGTYLLHRADLRTALNYFDRALALYDRTVHGNHTVIYGQDPAVVSLSYSAWSHWCLGETEVAQARTQQSLLLAEELGYPYNQVIAKTYAAVQLQYMDDAAACLRQAEAASLQATAQGFVLWQAMADFLRGWSHTRLGNVDTGMALMTASVNLYRATGAELGASYFAALQAEQLGKIGQMSLAMQTMTAAFALLERAQDRWCAAELHRIHGELLLAEARATTTLAALPAMIENARQAFETGRLIAQDQGAIWWQERCRRSLNQLTNLAPHS
ncbi:MAG: BTAD domain-containing putative transcriptional regulator [Caldilineaceae bacterium]